MKSNERWALAGLVALGALAFVAYRLQKQIDATVATGAVPVSTFQVLNGSFPGIGLVPLFLNPTAAQVLREQPVKSS